MKRILSLFLALVLLAGLYACEFQDSDILEPVTFYYPRQRNTDEAFANVVANGVLGSEVREASGHTEDLTYLLSLYLRGPLDSELKTPFPPGCSLLSVDWEDSTLCVTLAPAFATLENMERTIACACLAQTCFSLTDASQVQIKAPALDAANSVDMTIGPDSLLLEDNSGLPQQTIPEETQ